MKLKEIPRTATFAWTHDTAANTLVTGTASGAIDADFNSNTQLEIWNTGKSEPVFSTEVDARFHDLAVSQNNKLVAGAMENGVVNLWEYSGSALKSVGAGTNHKAAARAVAFNAENKLVSAGNNGEVFVWDVETLKGEAPGSSSRQDDLVGVAWNNRVNQILATAGTGGFTSIWDLRKRREVIHLHYTVAGSRLPASSVSWHAANSTKLVTSSSDDQNPVVLVWDLRNANSPETILEGHSAGVLSVDWCLQDPELLLSSGKDNRTLLWNPAATSAPLLAEYPISVGWTFKTKFNPRVPDIFASASFDGKLSVQTLQDTSEPSSEGSKKASGDAFWDSEEVVDAVHPQFHTHQAPAWLKRPVSASFGFGGKLVTVVGKEIKISTVKASATDVSSLKTALESKDYSSLVSNNKDKDWELLKAIVDGKPLFEAENADGASVDNDDDDDGFVISKDYAPGTEYKLLDGKHDKITKLVLAKKIAKAVDLLIDEGQHADALLLASYDPELLHKARNAYLEASQKPYIRAAWASQGNLSDFENVELDAWKNVLALVHSDPTKTLALGRRLLKAGRRDDALRVFLAGNNITEAGGIWLEELPAAKDKHAADAKSTAYQAHTKALQDVIEKLLVASKGAAIKDADTALYDTYRDFANILASQGDLDLASTLLDLLPSSYAQDKGRISGAQKSPVKQAKQTKSKYGQPQVVPAYGAPAVHRPAAVPSPIAPNAASGASTPVAPGAANGAATKTGNRPPAPVVQKPAARAPVVAPRAHNPYAPAGASPATSSPVNPYAAVAVPPVAAPIPSAPVPSAPPKSGKVSTTIRPPQHGWNDLPEQSLQNSLKARRPAAPAIIPNQFVDKSKVAAPPLRSPSGSLPPPKTGGPRPPSANSSGPTPPPPAPAKASNPYAPAPGAVRAVSPYAPPAPAAAAQVIPPAANPYAPAVGSKPMGAPVGPPQPKAAPAPPPPGKARTAANPPAPAAVAASLPVDTAPAAAEPKYPVGDREHIPADAKPIYESLSRAIETIRPSISSAYPKQMKDTERRINILFDHLNNQDLLSGETVQKLVQLSSALDSNDFDAAESTRTELATSSPDECGTWMTGLKRLVQMTSAITTTE